MDIFSFIIPPTILIICLGVIIFVVLAFKLSADVREVRRSRRLYKKLIEIAKKTSRKTISVVIELNQNADRLIPLLDSLYAESYPKLEVIIVIKHTAGRTAQAKLKYYRQKNHHKKLKLVKHVKGLDASDVIKKYASGYLVVPLVVGSKLSRHFLDDVSIDSLSSSRDVMAVRIIPALSNSLTSAMVAHFGIWRIFFASVRPKKVNKIQAGFVYRRQSIKDDKISEGLIPYVAHNATIVTTSKVLTSNNYMRQALVSIAKQASKWYVLTTLALGLIGLTALFVLMGADDGRILVGFIFITYVITHVGLVLSIKSYSVKDRASLALLAPFAAIYGVILVVATPIKGLMSFIISLSPKKLLQKRLNNNN